MPAPDAHDEAAAEAPVTVAVTGPTGTFGQALVPLLHRDGRIARIVGIARRPFDPAAHGWERMSYRQGDVRDSAALASAFSGADVVVHLAFLITGTGAPATTRAVNVDGTLNTFRAAAAAGARRFVFASSVAAYGFHPDNPVGMAEDWPVRPADHLFYGREKAEVEQLLGAEATAHPDLDLYVLRPSVVLGPHTMGAKDVPRPLEVVGRGVGRIVRRSPVHLPAVVPDLPVQVVHEDDVAQAFLLCIVGAGPPGAYNIAGDGTVSIADAARTVGLHPLTVPGRRLRSLARTLARLQAAPLVPPAVGWAEAVSHPAIMDTTKARRDLGWRPRYSALAALQATLDAGRVGDGVP